MSTQTVSKNYLIKWAIIIGLTLACFLIPEGGIITMNVKLFFAITVFGLALAAFEIVPTLMISLLMPALWMILKVAPANVVLSPWMTTTPLMIVGAFFMAASLEDCGLLRRLAYYLMCKVKGSYMGLLFSIMIVTVILNILTSGRGYLIMAPLAVGLCMSLDGMQKNLGAGLASAVMVGGCTSHVYTYQASGWGVLMQMAGNYVGPTDITPLSIMLHNWPMFFVSLVIIFIAGKMFKPENGLGEITYFQTKLDEMGSISRREKINGVMLAIVLVYIFGVGWHKLDVNLGFAIIPWMVYLPFLNGADANTVRKINLEVVFFVTACMAIGTVATSLGIGVALAGVVESFLNGSTSAFAIMSIVFAIVFILNFLMTPLAIFSLITDPILMMVTQMGYSPIPFTYAISACSEAIIFPYEYVPYLIVYGFGMIRMNDFIKYNIIRSILVFGGILFVLVPYWYLIGLF